MQVRRCLWKSWTHLLAFCSFTGADVHNLVKLDSEIFAKHAQREASCGRKRIARPITELLWNLAVGTYFADGRYNRNAMRSRRYKMVGRVLAFLLLCLSLSPLAGRAEAQMRCAGASLNSAPCDHIEISATGLTETQAYARLSMMRCCRSLHGGMMRGCPLQHRSSTASAAGYTAASRSLSADPHCVVTVRVITTGTSTPPVTHPRWFLTANPALAPPATVRFVRVPASSVPVFSTCSSASSSHAPQHSHGLRAPPAA